MAEDLYVPETEDREEIFEALIPQMEALITEEPNLIANLANISAVLKAAMQYLWVGFYLVDQEELVLGPFQGPVACTRIKYGQGVCGTAWASKTVMIIPDVDDFPGHITCSSASRSEIVIPVMKGGQVRLILDIDSDKLNYFDEIDQKYLQKVVHLIEDKL
ncbi:MAG: GAF domain-containing protein [Candidatus Cyclobacteriaceae bacterium M3_2C_046]